MKNYLSEYIGTFLLVFCGTGAIIIDGQTGGAITHLGIAITFGLIVMVMIYSLGEISGAHINPAVTIAFAVAGRFATKKVLPYLIAQCAGAISASYLLFFILPGSDNMGATIPSGTAMQSLIFECILSFILMLVILRVSTGAKEKGITAGMAIGSVVLLEAIFAGPVSGASMNPARSLGPAVVAGNYTHLWIYFAGPLAGMLVATFISNILSKDNT